jgi:hypothetical protein
MATAAMTGAATTPTTVPTTDLVDRPPFPLGDASAEGLAELEGVSSSRTV